MFERAYIKELSKQRMRGFRGNAILVTLITLFLCGDINLSRFNVELPLDFTDADSAEDIFSAWSDQFRDILPMAVGAVLAVAVIGVVVGMLYSVFVANVLTTGNRGWFMRYWRGEYPSVGELFASFRIYLPVLVTNLLRSVYVFLWSLLLIVPGIVKSYAYSMADYIIYENPNMNATDALKLSERLTDGAKWELFVFDLSFFGWEMLSALTVGILGIVYVTPYKCTAHAGIYESLKASAIYSGRVSWQDFGQMPPVMPPQEPGM